MTFRWFSLFTFSVSDLKSVWLLRTQNFLTANRKRRNQTIPVFQLQGIRRGVLVWPSRKTLDKKFRLVCNQQVANRGGSNCRLQTVLRAFLKSSLQFSNCNQQLAEFIDPLNFANRLLRESSVFYTNICLARLVINVKS